MNLPYEIAKITRDELQASVTHYSNKLKAFPHNSMGLTEEAVKATATWKATFAAYHNAFRKLQQFNRSFVREYKAEIRAERNKRFSK